MIPIDLKKLWAVHRALIANNVRYGLGAKAASMSSAPSNISRIDCSGEFRYLAANATDQKLIIPDGSWIQRAWFEKQGLKQVPYSECGKADPDRLFAAFMTAGVNGVGRVGHVWWINNGRTLESYGGHGVGTRDWNHGSLVRHVHKCFEYPTTVTQSAAPKPDVGLILVTKKGDELAYHRLQSAKLADGRFTADSDEILAVLSGGKKRVEIRDFLGKLGAPVYDEGNYLSDPKEPRQYLFVETQ